MNSYLINYLTGESQEVEAEFYEADDGYWVFLAAQEEVIRVEMAKVASISKAR